MPKYSENKELDFKLNGFGKQKVFTEAEASSRQILSLLFMRPGDYPSLPNMGINISKEIRYKDMDYITGNVLKEKIVEQIRKYAAQVEMEDLEITPVKYKGQYFVMLVFKLVAERTITIAMTRKKKVSSLIDVQVQFD